tara:strand:+ start:3180 stop:4661 length:1482 start_codon:yes stop_codon:yes gene_type:complete
MKSFGNIAKDGQVRAVASGTLTDGKTVIVNTDGTVSAVASTGAAASVGAATTFESGQVEHMGGAYDSNTNRVVFCYKDDSNSDYGTAVAGTVSGTSITFGTPVVYSSINTNISRATFDSNANKVAIFYYKNNVDTTHGIVATTSSSDNSISFGSSTQFDGTSVSRMSCTFDSSNNKCVVVYTKYTPGGSPERVGRAIVGTISGTSISFGSTVDWQNEALATVACTFDSNSNKVVAFFSVESNNSKFEARVGTVSGTSISFGSAVEIDGSVRGEGIGATFDSNSNKVVAAFRDSSSSNKGKAAVGTVSGTSISFGTPVLFTNSAVGTDGATTQLSFDTTNNKVGIAFNASTNVEGRFIVGTVSGTSISFDGEQTFTSAGRPGDIAGCLYDDNADKFVVGYGETSTRIGRANVIQIDTLSTNLTSENYIGFSDGAFATTQSTVINTANTIDRNQSGLTAGQTYFVQVDGTIGLTAADPSVTAGTAISATELIVKG